LRALPESVAEAQARSPAAILLGALPTASVPRKSLLEPRYEQGWGSYTGRGEKSAKKLNKNK
jgi:hypothetical protein